MSGEKQPADEQDTFDIVVEEEAEDTEDVDDKSDDPTEPAEADPSKAARPLHRIRMPSKGEIVHAVESVPTENIEIAPKED